MKRKASVGMLGILAELLFVVLAILLGGQGIIFVKYYAYRTRLP